MDLCGYATLATAHCLVSILDYKRDKIIFETLSGALLVSIEKGIYKMDFHARMPVLDILPTIILNSLNLKPKAVYKSSNYLLVYENETEIRNIHLDRQLFDQINLETGGVIVSTTGDNCDFVSRFSPHKRLF